MRAGEADLSLEELGRAIPGAPIVYQSLEI